jgi:signal transduction histidine kinase
MKLWLTGARSSIRELACNRFSMAPLSCSLRHRSGTKTGGWFIASLAVIAAELAIITVLLLERRRRKTADLAIKDLTGRVINAGEEERKRIGRELHDDIGQRLSLVSIELDEMQRESPPAAQASEQNYIAEPLQQLNEIIGDVHNLSHQLHSSKLQILGLEVALKDMCKRVAKSSNVDIQLVSFNVPSWLPEDIALCFYRVAQEGVSNAMRYSRSPDLMIRLETFDGTLVMTIRDHGIGFDASVATSGIGLATMRERMKLVEGKLFVTTKPGLGTEVRAEAPIDQVLRDTLAA